LIEQLFIKRVLCQSVKNADRRAASSGAADVDLGKAVELGADMGFENLASADAAFEAMRAATRAG
jgi:hypothetical protein